MDKLEIHELLDQLLYLYDAIEEVHLTTKEYQRMKKVNAKKVSPSALPLLSETLDEETLSQSSLLLSNLKRRNGLVTGNQLSYKTTMIIDSQKDIHKSQKSQSGNDQFTVASSTNAGMNIRYEELCLILLRGYMEKLSLQLSPCQNRFYVRCVF